MLVTKELALWTLLSRGHDWLVLQESTRHPRRSLTQAQTSESHHLLREAVPLLLVVPHCPVPLGPTPQVTVVPKQLCLPVCPSSYPVVRWDGRLGTWEPHPDGRHC